MSDSVAYSSALLEPSLWVRRWAHLVGVGDTVLDYACGSGRHARFFASRGARVSAVDRDGEALEAIGDLPGITTRQLDLEGPDWPLEGETYDAVIVTNYLYRPRLESLLGLVRPRGVLIYETFAVGNEALGRPRNPDFLLREEELLDWVLGRMRIVAFEQGRSEWPRAAVMQRLCVAGGERAYPVALNIRGAQP